MAPAPAVPMIRAIRWRRPAGFCVALVLAVAAAPGWTAAHAGGDNALSAPLVLPELEAGAIDPDAGPDAPALLDENGAPLGGEAAISVPKPAGGPELKLHWQNERYAADGPEGLQIDGDASGAEIGVNYKLESTVTIGALAQFDPAAEMLFGGEPVLSDHGWMAGPVTTVHLAPGLVLDARAAWGSTESGADDLIGAAPAVQRRLVSARLANARTFGAWRFTPSVNLSHFEERLPSAGASRAEASASHVTGFGRIDVAPELAYRIDMASATFIEPKAVLGGFWAFDSLSDLEPGAGAPLEPRLKAEAGVTVGVIDGPKLQALGAVEEGGGTAPDAWSGRVQLSVPLP